MARKRKGKSFEGFSSSFPYASILKGEFPSLSNTSQMSASNQSSMWSSGGSRNVGGAVHRGSGTPLSQQSQQDDLFVSSRLASNQGSFRFGTQGSAAQTSQTHSSANDEFPPLNRNANGDIGGQDRTANLMSSLGFGSQTTTPTSAIHTSRAGNGLLNAVSANSRAAEARSPTSVVRPQDPRSPVGEDEGRQKPPGYWEGSMTSQSSVGDSSSQLLGSRNPLGAIGNEPPAGKVKEDDKDQTGDVQDPLEGMAPIDKWGLKGLRTLMNNFTDFNALTCGIDPMFSTQIYSLFDEALPRPAVPKFCLPDCYHVKNVQPVEAKMQSFNEETLMWIFYSCPGDVKQQMVAVELTNRNWRWHKKIQVWLTKDDMMVPQALGPTHERGYYVIWDTANWRKERIWIPTLGLLRSRE
ncbi:hypothetical protein B0T26DRAFT_770521 [Lasiosphaeria miniovina]|uniref:NOT2/NOT3/NOT5 C-terminal domain-containing protein n=1 Tax=Lasiosphaeria miniovina TaxID=1954250 RepID=A0AA40AUK3_9PEZI|nr:uncharacterized protein B0T26DRAFT_770521 [Lasiosphaeria miniovina]KAK0722231.1 hypothetical protein B0T26DRAFT_770521 [Lasiosphaeria miniovina]